MTGDRDDERAARTLARPFADVGLPAAGALPWLTVAVASFAVTDLSRSSPEAPRPAIERAFSVLGLAGHALATHFSVGPSAPETATGVHVAGAAVGIGCGLDRRHAPRTAVVLSTGPRMGPLPVRPTAQKSSSMPEFRTR